MTISERIFYLLETKNLKKADLSKATGIKSNTISDWETKKTNPQSDKIARICDFLEVSCDYLLTGKESTPHYLTVNEKRMLSIFKELSEREQLLEITSLERLLTLTQSENQTKDLKTS